MRISDNRYQRDHMRLDLALRFLGHGARTHTIRAWTMLSDDRIRKLYRSYVYTVDDAPRHRGKSPQQAAFFMRGVLKAYDVRDRRVWVADSFGGVPPPDPARYPADAGLAYSDVRYLAVSADEVRRSFARYALLDDQVVFTEGLFKDSLPALRGHQWSVVRLDGDLYESTMDALNNLYDGLSVGGFLIVDDYGAVEACRIAVDKFRAERDIREDLRWIDWSGVYWQRRDS